MMNNEIYVILHNIRSAHNVGSIFRTADAVGVSKIYLCGHTPCPVDRFGRDQKEIGKVALGAEKSVRWKYEEDVQSVMQQLRSAGAHVVAVEQDKRSIPYTDVEIQNSTAFIFGNEVSGISEDILNTADMVIEIPMSGEKESLNVSVAVGVILFSLSNLSGLPPLHSSQKA